MLIVDRKILSTIWFFFGQLQRELDELFKFQSTKPT